jgi:hypothetical protein
MKWFYMQAGAMPLLNAALAALYFRPGKRSPPPEEADDGRQYYDGNDMTSAVSTRYIGSSF